VVRVRARARARARVMVGTAVATEPLDVLDLAVGDLHDVLALEACTRAAGQAQESRLQLGYAIGARLVVGDARGVGRWWLEVGVGWRWAWAVYRTGSPSAYS
jgi:hypothetical protein